MECSEKEAIGVPRCKLLRYFGQAVRLITTLTCRNSSLVVDEENSM